MVRVKKYFVFPDGTEVSISSIEQNQFRVQFDRFYNGISSRALWVLPNLACSECVNFTNADYSVMYNYIVSNSNALLNFARGMS